MENVILTSAEMRVINIALLHIAEILLAYKLDPEKYPLSNPDFAENMELKLKYSESAAKKIRALTEIADAKEEDSLSLSNFRLYKPKTTQCQKLPHQYPRSLN